MKMSEMEDKSSFFKNIISNQTDKIKKLEKELKHKKEDSINNEKIMTEKENLEQYLQEKSQNLAELKKKISKIEEEISSDEEAYELLKKIRDNRYESECEEKELEDRINEYRIEKEKIRKKLEYINLSEEELEERIEEKIEILKQKENEILYRKKKELETSHEEAVFELEKFNRMNLRKEKEKYELEEEKLQKEYNRKNEELDERFKTAEKEKDEIIKFLGFSEFMENNAFLFRDKIEAYLILNKHAGKKRIFPGFRISDNEFLLIYRNVVMSINEMIRLHNENVDLKKKVKDEREE